VAGCGATEALNVAVAEDAFASETVHVPVPEHAPDQPAKIELVSGFSASVTDVPLSKCAVHAAPQLIPAGLLVTVPTPVPAF
jgi:hypothetical protein